MKNEDNKNRAIVMLEKMIDEIKNNKIKIDSCSYRKSETDGFFVNI